MLDVDDLVFSPPELGCVLYLPGPSGGGSKIYDRSPYGNHGTITGATWKRLPSGLWCLSFDGQDDYVDFGDQASLDGVSALTILAWLRTVVDISNNQTILSKWDALDSSNQAYLLDINGSKFRIGIRTTAGTIFRSGGTPVQNKWHFVVATYDGIEQRLFVDTAEVNHYPQSGTVQVTSEEFYVGAAENNGLVLHFQGMIALVRVYNRALSALEIQNHFHREKHLFGVC